MDLLKTISRWCLRAALAGIFLYHGLDKLSNIPTYAAGMKMSADLIYVLGVAETMGGIFIFVGGLNLVIGEMLTRLAGAIFSVVMIGAIALVHWPQWSFVSNSAKPMGGMEFQVLILAISLLYMTSVEDL